MKRLPSGTGKRSGSLDALSAANSSQLKTRPGDRNSLLAGSPMPAPGPRAPAGAPPGAAPASAPRPPPAPRPPAPRPPRPSPPGRGTLGGSPIHSPSGKPAILGFSFSPSYQNTFSAGMSPYGAKSKRITDALGNMKGLTPSFLIHSTPITLRLER